VTRYPGGMPSGRAGLVVAVLALVPAVLVPPACAAPTATPSRRSGFEVGSPGEWLDHDNGRYTGRIPCLR
jgi:hypothetical protein